MSTVTTLMLANAFAIGLYVGLRLTFRRGLSSPVRFTVDDWVALAAIMCVCAAYYFAGDS